MSRHSVLPETANILLAQECLDPQHYKTRKFEVIVVRVPPYFKETLLVFHNREKYKNTLSILIQIK